ncbi:MAG: nucleoside recognition domain-containing protein [Prevotella sp.]
MIRSNVINTFLRCLHTAIPSAWKSVKWLLKLMIPISLVVTLMDYWGILEWLASYLNPIFVYIGLPGSSAVIFMSGAAAGTYAGIAAMMSLPLTMKQATIIASMIALCHALPMECAVNKKTGSSFWRMAVIRIIMAFVCAIVLNMLLSEDNARYIYIGVSSDASFSALMKTWIISQIQMSVIVFVIVYSLMVVQRLIEEYSLLVPLSRLFAPLMTAFGLPRATAYMWLVGNVLGISYGSAVMVELEDKGLISKEEANDVNYHLIMNHSLLEDTIVFSVAGISALCLVTVRVVSALVLVWGRRLLNNVLCSLKRPT